MHMHMGQCQKAVEEVNVGCQKIACLKYIQVDTCVFMHE